MKRMLLLPALLAAATGCDELEPFLPTVTFDRMDVQQIDFEGASVDFVFAVENPNPVEIPLSSFSYALGFEGIELLSGDDADGFTLEAVGGSELALPLSLGWQDAWNTVQATRGEDFVDFAISGDFGFETQIGEILLPYAEAGDFPALRTPKFSFRKLRVPSVDLLTQTARVELDFDVDNAHASTLFFDRFDYTVRLGGKRVGAGVIPSLGGVDGAMAETMTLPLDIDLLAVGETVANAIVNKRPMNVRLAATMDVDTPWGVLPLAIDEKGELTVE